MKRDDLEQQLAAFFEELAARYGDDAQAAPADTTVNGTAPFADADPVVHELVRSFLTWDAPRDGVDGAFARLAESFVDFNEMRVCLPETVAGLLGTKYPAAAERCGRMRAALREVFERENGLTLAHLRDESKRAARAYLDSLPGITPFVASRVALLCCESHAFPVDSVLHGMLDERGAIDDGEDAAAASGRLERAVRAGDALACYRRLERAAREGLPAPKRPAKKPASKKTGAKKTGKTR